MSDLIDAYERHLRAAGASDRTIQDRCIILRRLHHDLRYGLAWADTEELEAWLGRYTGWTLYTYANCIRSAYATWDGWLLDGDPAADMARPRQPRGVPHPVSDQELAAALTRSGEPWHTLIMLAAYGGLRASEAAGVWREDVTEQAIRIRVAKGGDPEAVDTHPAVWELAEPRPAGPLALTPRGKPVTGRWIFSYGRRHFDSIDLPGVHLHRFRHWYASTLLDGGADLRTVQDALRHKSIVSTQGYTRVRGGKRRLAIRSLPTPTQTPAGTR